MSKFFVGIEEALAAQVIAQTQLLNENNHKGDALEFAKNSTEPGADILLHVSVNLQALNQHRQGLGVSDEGAKDAAINILNYTLFYMINKGLL